MDIAAADVIDPLDKISAAETGPAASAPPTMSIRPSGSRAAEEPHRTSPANSGAGAPGAAISIQAEGTTKARTARLNKPVRNFIETPFHSQTLVPGNAKWPSRLVRRFVTVSTPPPGCRDKS